jgi:hypothetical protein
MNKINESKKLRTKEVILLPEMKSNLQFDLFHLDLNIHGNKEKLLSNCVILAALRE